MALRITPTIALQALNLFSGEVQTLLPDLKKWMDAPDSDAGKKYRHMSPKQFDTFIKDALSRGKNAGKTVEKSGSRRRRFDDRTDALTDSDEEGPSKSAQRQKTKEGHKRHGASSKSGSSKAARLDDFDLEEDFME